MSLASTLRSSPPSSTTPLGTLQGRRVAQGQHAPRQLSLSLCFTPFSCPTEGREGDNMAEERDRTVEERREREYRAKSKGRWKTTSSGFHRFSLTSGCTLCVSSRTKALLPQFEEHVKHLPKFFKYHLIIGRPSYSELLFFQK